MLWITLLFALLIALGALAFVIWPLVGQEMPLLVVEDDQLADLLARKDNALRSLKDLEFDHQVGKISDEDFVRLNDRLSRQAMNLLQQVERVRPEGGLLDEQLEAEIAKLRRVQASTRVVIAEQHAPTVAAVQEAPPQAIASVDNVSAPPGAVRFCTECGARITVSFKFCANCGTPIANMVAEQER